MKCIWLFGKSGSGKSYLLSKVLELLQDTDINHHCIDDDDLYFKKGVSTPLMNRVSTSQKLIEVSKHFRDAGVNLFVSMPDFAVQEQYITTMKKSYIKTVLVKAPDSICMRRDPHHYYRDIKKGTLKPITSNKVNEGLYDLVLDMNEYCVESASRKILEEFIFIRNQRDLNEKVS